MKHLKSSRFGLSRSLTLSKISRAFTLLKINRAFTLLESLLVLSITCFLILMFSTTMGNTIHIVRGELFVAEFEGQYKNTQLRASALRKGLEFSASGDSLTAGSQVINIPEEVEVSSFVVKFDKYGNNSSLTKLKLRLPYELKTITYQLEMGSGKYKKTIQ